MTDPDFAALLAFLANWEGIAKPRKPDDVQELERMYKLPDVAGKVS